MPVNSFLGMAMVQVDLVFDAADVVGESAVWDDRTDRLIWIDIIGRRIHALHPASGEHQLWPMTDRPTSIGLRADGGAILGMEKQICLWDWLGTPPPVCAVEPDLPANRLNEGCVGPDGAFWVGTMLNNINDDDTPSPITKVTGRLYRYDGTLTRISDDCFGITNTLVWPTPDLLITADTMANTLYSYRIRDGLLMDRKPLMQGYARGLPDGSCLDAEGCIWTCRVVGGACLTRVTPEGNLDRVIELPCQWPTSCTFGGADLTTLYVTSARFTQSPAHLAANPHEGAVFALVPGVKGVPANRFGPTA
ncbi:MAG: SMP-30/gluconolactonase/LRE family protein [Paracoccaceae bacterium]